MLLDNAKSLLKEDKQLLLFNKNATALTGEASQHFPHLFAVKTAGNCN